MSSRLEKNLGIDSLGRTELVLRLERAFGARLPIGLVAEADTVGDLLRVLEQGAFVRSDDRRRAVSAVVGCGSCRRRGAYAA